MVTAGQTFAIQPILDLGEGNFKQTLSATQTVPLSLDWVCFEYGDIHFQSLPVG